MIFFIVRFILIIECMISEFFNYLLSCNFILSYLILVYKNLINEVIECFRSLFNVIIFFLICCYGDCYIVNILWYWEIGFWFVDFDDC